MKNGKKQMLSKPLFFFYCLAISYFVGGCVMSPATAEDLANGDGYLVETSVTVTTSPVDTTVVVMTPGPTVPGSHILTPPGVILNNTLDSPPDLILEEPCRCAWETWSEGGGLMCAGIRCSATCDMATRGCIERRACVTAGI